ncbi:MAG: hypothetical protein WBG47_08535 [Gordonia sp. (in: high G+C Gram-positive bacteria)]|uniref:hypothetical protein n=1 Tax=Gordonia sp. (in: high G+C Gram-positive bacteria) TaxID=84139 RepID=UPI003C756813
MSTPGQPNDSSFGPYPGVDNFAETAARPMPQAPMPHAPMPGPGYPGGAYPQQYPTYAMPPEKPKPPVFMIVALTAIVILLAAAAFVWIKVANSGADQAAVTEQQQQQPQAQPTVTSVVADPETEAATQLRNQITTDAALFRSSLADRWTAQISAKRPGLYAENRTWDNRSILSEFQAMQSRYPQVKLIDSSAWPVFSESGWMVTVSAQGFATAESALAWCRGNGLDKDHCFAKLISSTRGPEGSTLYQR